MPGQPPVLWQAEQAAAATGGRSTAPWSATGVSIDRRTVARLEKPRSCYICKVDFVDLHVFYDSLCPACAELNYAKRFQTAYKETNEGMTATIMPYVDAELGPQPNQLLWTMMGAVFFVLLTIPLARYTDYLIAARERRERAAMA